MNQDWTFDDLLRQGLLLAAAEDAEELERNEDEEIAFSPKYLRFREKFLEDPLRYAKRKKRPVWKKVLQTAACLLLSAALGLAVLLAVSSEAQAELKQWIRTVSNTSVSYDFYAEPTNQVPPLYVIGALPEGYAEVKKIEIPKSRLVIYQNEEGQRITFQYMYMEEGVELGIETESIETRDVEVNGCRGYFYFVPDGSDSSAVVWIDEQAGLLFSLDMWGTIDEILSTAESVLLME